MKADREPLHGVIVPVITPVDRQEGVDKAAFGKIAAQAKASLGA